MGYYVAFRRVAKVVRMAIFLIAALSLTFGADSNSVNKLYSEVIQAIISRDAKKFDSISIEKPFDYFEGDAEHSPDEVGSQYYALDSSGYYGKEREFVVDRNGFLSQLSKGCNEICRKKTIQFSPLKKVSNQRREFIVDPFCDASKMHFVLIRFGKDWKLAGTFFEFANTEPCRNESRNSRSKIILENPDIK